MDDKAAFDSPPSGFAAKVRDNIEHGKLERVEYESKTVGVKRWMQVYTPPGYSSEKKYPQFYLLHGIGGNEKEVDSTGSGSCRARQPHRRQKDGGRFSQWQRSYRWRTVGCSGRTRGVGFGGWGEPFKNDLINDIIHRIPLLGSCGSRSSRVGRSFDGWRTIVDFRTF